MVTFLYSTNHLLHLNASRARIIVDISMAILLTPEPKTDNSCIYSSTIYISSPYKQGITDTPVLTSTQNV